MATTNPLHPLSKEVADQLREQMRRMLVRLDEWGALASSPSAWMPPVDVCELKDTVFVRVELPGVTSDQVRLTIFDNILKVEGRKDRSTPTGPLLPESERPVRFICLERSFGNFAFRVQLHWPIDASNISAEMADGVLQIRLPKTETSGREISIPITE